MTPLTIVTSHEVSDSTWDHTEAFAPRLAGDTLTIYTGNGRRRSWGTPSTTSTVILNSGDLVAVHVGWHHKYGGGQTWRYYTASDDGWQQASWVALPDDDRMRVISAYRSAAPTWATPPGKLRSERKPPTRASDQTTYKIVRRLDDGRMVSLFDGSTEYVIGQEMRERARSNHQGGYYSYPTRAGVLDLCHRGDLTPREYLYGVLVLLECRIGGTIIRYGEKISSSRLTPLRVLDTFDATTTALY